MLLLAGCTGGGEPGTVSLSLAWEEEPTEPVWIWVKVEFRETPTEEGTILASAPPAEYSPGKALAFEMPQVDNGENRHVVVEVRKGASSGLPVLYYGISEPFSVAPGKHVHVDVPLKLEKPEAEQMTASVNLMTGDVEVDSICGLEVWAMTIRTRSVGAVEVVLANDAAFAANLTTVAICRADGYVY